MEYSLTKGKIYFELFHNDTRAPWFSKQKLFGSLLLQYVDVDRTFYSLVESFFRVNLINNPICKCNYKNENLNHVIWQCKLYNRQRSQLIISLLKLNLHLPLNTKSLIAKPNIAACHSIILFFENYNLKVPFDAHRTLCSLTTYTL